MAVARLRDKLAYRSLENVELLEGDPERVRREGELRYVIPIATVEATR